MRSWLAWCAVAGALSGCGSAAAPVDAGAAADVAWRAVPDARCDARVGAVPARASPHVLPDDGPVAYHTNPPSSGPHHPAWARWGVAASPVPRENYVHNLEHGGVVIAYRCSNTGCPMAGEVAAAVASLPPDPACAYPLSPSPARVVATPDPLLDSPVAAAAWGHVYQADCVDAASLRAFYAEHVGRAPEDTCANGTVP